MYPRRFLPATETPTTLGSEERETLVQEIPVHRHGLASFSFQSEKADAPSESTADFRERSERPSEVRESVEFSSVSNRKRQNSIQSVGISMFLSMVFVS